MPSAAPRLAVAALALFCLGAAKKPPMVDVRIHSLGTAAEAPTFAIPATLLNGTPVFLARMPLLTQREIKAIYPFVAADGSHGTYFKVDNHGSRLLHQHTMSERGETLVVLINGRQVSNLLVDRPIDDGIVSIPRGLSADDIALLTSVFPVIGQEAATKKRR
jgi:hypothetical protein